MLKKSRTYVAVLLALVMCVSSFIPAFAMEAEYNTQAVITKNLRMPEGTATPNVTFNFAAKAISHDGRGDASVTTKMPVLNNLAVAYPGSGVAGTPSNGVISIQNQSANLLAGINFNTLGAGVYKYEITELPNTTPGVGGDEKIWPSDAKYILTVNVDNVASGGTKILSVFAEVVTLVEEEGKDPVVKLTKVDAAPGKGGMIFTNTYVKTNANENPDPLKDDTLTISNNVIGTLANLLQHFNYTITMASNKIHEEMEIPEFYKAYIIENGEVIDPVYNAATGLIVRPGGGALAYIEIDSNDDTSFSLKHGQSLVFVDTPVGTRYDITQAGATDYEPSYIITSNGTVVTSPPVAGTSGQSIVTGDRLIGDATNLAAFTNVRDEVVLTGLSVDNLPFVLMIIFGLGCIVTYIVVGARKRALRRDK